MKNIEVRKNGTIQVSTINTLPSKTQQQFKDETDVNNIIRKYKTTGVWPSKQSQGVFADVSGITDLHEAINKIDRASQAFSLLPSEVRLRFKNDPAELLRFMQDPKNHDEGVQLGIFEGKIKKQRVEVIPNDDLNNDSKKPDTKQKQKPETDPKSKLDEK